MKTRELIEIINGRRLYTVSECDVLIAVFDIRKSIAAILIKKSKNNIILNTDDIELAEACVKYIRTPVEERV